MNQIMPQYNPVPTIPGYIPNDNSIWMTSDDDQSPYGLGMQKYGSNIIFFFPVAQIPSLIVTVLMDLLTSSVIIAIPRRHGIVVYHYLRMNRRGLD